MWIKWNSACRPRRSANKVARLLFAADYSLTSWQIIMYAKFFEAC
jgi:hypothetical protein